MQCNNYRSNGRADQSPHHIYVWVFRGHVKLRSHWRCLWAPHVSSLSPPVAIMAPKFLETCFDVLETSFQAKICANFLKIFTNSLKICTNSQKYALTSRKYALTSRKDYKIVLLRDFGTIFGFMAHPLHRGFTMILMQAPTASNVHELCPITWELQGCYCLPHGCHICLV